MRGNIGVTLGMFLALASARAAGPEASKPPPADFKLVIESFGVHPDPITRADMVVWKGRAYYFISDADMELILFNPPDERLVLLDLERLIQTEILLKTLDAYEGKLHDAIAAVIAKREKAGGRANRVAADMSRDLIEPRLAVAFDAAAHRLRLTNPSVEVDALGAPDPDPDRRALIARTLSALITLDAVRHPQSIPPFVRLETLKVLTVDHALRPVETSFLYRLAGTPRRFRWTYRLVPALTARESEALEKIETMRSKAPFVRFNVYEEPAPKKR